MKDNTCPLLECRMGQKRSDQLYPKEFKEETATLLRDQGYSV